MTKATASHTALMTLWKNFRDAWLPGLICTGLGVYLGWWISADDTRSELRSLQETNETLTKQTGMLAQQNLALNQQATLLRDQNGKLANQSAALGSQSVTLTSILKAVAAKGQTNQLALDRRGNVTYQGTPIIDSNGTLLTDEKGNVITTENGVPITTENGVVGPSPKH